MPGDYHSNVTGTPSGRCGKKNGESPGHIVDRWIRMGSPTSDTETGLPRPDGVDHGADCVDYRLRLIDVDVVRAVPDDNVPAIRKESSKTVLGLHLRRPERIGKRRRHLGR